METQLLKEPDVFPSDEVLHKALGESFSVYKEFLEAITDEKYALIPQWRYYRDGKAWLCKVAFKKKTVSWLSVWDGFFKLGFYFTERNSPGVLELDIDENLKKSFRDAKTFGTLRPLVFKMRSKEQIRDALRATDYKKSLK